MAGFMLFQLSGDVEGRQEAGGESGECVDHPRTCAHRLAVNAVLYAAIEGTRTVRALHSAENREDAEGFQPYLYFGVEPQDEAA